MQAMLLSWPCPSGVGDIILVLIRRTRVQTSCMDVKDGQPVYG